MKKKILILISIFYFGMIGKGISQAPVNDECTGAILISTVPFGSSCSSSVNATTMNGTRSSPNPSCTGTENNDDIWFRFVANSHTVILRFGTVVNDGTGNEGTAGFAFYAQSCPTTTSTILCNNLGSAGLGFTIINGLTIGETYYLRFWSVLGGTNSITFSFCVQDVPAAPSNDECANALLISTEPEGTICNSGIIASTVGSTRSTPDPPCQPAFSNDDIWYRFVANTNAVRFNFSNAIQPLTTSGIANVSVALYETSCPATTTGLICNSNLGANSGSALLGGLTAGNTYYLRLYSFASNNYMNLNFCLVDITLPQNDECTNATPLNLTNGFCASPLRGDLRNATVSSGLGTPSCVGLLLGEDVWFSVVIPASGSIVAQTAPVDNSVNDVVMEAYSGICGSLSLIGCDDNGNPDPGDATFHARIALANRSPGEIILLRVVPFGTINRGPFAICAWDPTVLPAISAGGDCIVIPPVIIDSAHANRYTRVPLFDAAGNIVATIFPNGNTLGTINSSLFVNGSGTVRSVNNHFYLDRNFELTSTISGTIRVRIFVKNSELAAIQSVDPSVTGTSDLRINKTSTGCQPLFSGTPILIQQDSSRSYGTDHYVEFFTTTSSSFYLAGGTGALPLRFISFDVEKGSSGILLKWSVEKDESISEFHVEFSSDGRNFKTIGTVNRNEFNGSSSAEWSYTFLDRSMHSGNVFYRIKMVDLNGIIKYSSIQFVANSNFNSGSFGVFPNPANQFIYIKSDKLYGLAEYQVFNSSGSKIRQGQLILNQNGSSLIDVHALPQGSYMIRLRVLKTGAVHTLRFIRN